MYWEFNNKKGNDCGVFTIAFKVEICKANNNPSSIVFNQKAMRQHLKMCLEKGYISDFPKAASRKGIQFSKPDIVTEELYCVCRMPDYYGDRMIACDACTKWFHCKCVQVVKKESGQLLGIALHAHYKSTTRAMHGYSNSTVLCCVIIAPVLSQNRVY